MELKTEDQLVPVQTAPPEVKRRGRPRKVAKVVNTIKLKILSSCYYIQYDKELPIYNLNI